MPPVKKRKIKVTHENMFVMKEEPLWDINPLNSKLNFDYNIDMNAETVIKLCKLVSF